MEHDSNEKISSTPRKRHGNERITSKVEAPFFSEEAALERERMKFASEREKGDKKVAIAKFNSGMSFAKLILTIISVTWIIEVVLLLCGVIETLSINLIATLIPILTAMMGFLFSEYNKK